MFVTWPVMVISSCRVGSSGFSDVRVMATEATGSVAAAGDGISTKPNREPNTKQGPETATASSTRAVRTAHHLLT
jgi:hypothetical protein